MISKVQLSIFTKRYDWTRAIHSVSTDNGPTPWGVLSLYVTLCLARCSNHLFTSSVSSAGRFFGDLPAAAWGCDNG